MSPVFIDTNIPMYAGGRAHPLREPARRVIRAIVAGSIEAVTDPEVFQEILYRYFHIGERAKGLQMFDTFFRIMEGHVLPIGDSDLLAAREFAERYPKLGPRDLIHLGVMVRQEVAEIITADLAFDGIAEVRRIDLATWVPV
ncbi:MAG: type II toxin-antitoxin system VapC family toxin [Chloroflexi bacterium]|nr:type II toxin-antitoxin system VapC family toxin [Chloroflexota bacterium]